MQAIKEMCAQKLILGQLFNAASAFTALFDGWQNAKDDLSPDELAAQVAQESGYLDMLKKENSVEAQGRIENIRELINSMSDEANYPTLDAFLEHVSLITEADNAVSANNVFLMTLHSAKGLEFDTVFLPGWEEGLFPHERALNEGGGAALEEERRLAYVAITRAKQNLYILTAYARKMFGQWQNNQPSRFLNEIPPTCLQIINNSYQNQAYYPKQKQVQNKTFEKPQTQRKARVYHTTFGYGTLLRIEADNKCEVIFDKAGRKMVYGSYLRKV